MRFSCGPSWYEKHLAKQKWHRRFAWRPIRVATGDCRWLEYYERKGTFRDYAGYGWWDWEYRAISDDRSHADAGTAVR